MTSPRALTQLLLAGLLSAGVGCKCNGGNVVPTNNQCEGVAGLQAGKNDACDPAAADACGDHFACKAVKGRESVNCCQFADRTCLTSADCCTGQGCNTNRKLCFDERTTCASDAECGDKGDRFCEVYSDNYGTESRCRHKACGPLGECAQGLSCFQGECIAGLPCDGACVAGEACVPASGKCQGYKSPTNRTAAACPATCNTGFIGTFKDNRNLWDSCNLPAVQCVCAELPGLVSNDVGRFSALASDPGKGLLVSAYDGKFGDLVVARYDATFKRVGTDYVDGVPTGGAPTFGPSGARGGVEAPGDDVGRYTDIATFGGRAFVSYYDVTRGDLKVAIRGADGTWSTHRVDGTTADLGLYTSIAVDSDGIPAISYFQRGGDASFDATSCPTPVPTGPKAFITALKFARATSATPGATADWQVRTIACQSRPTPACFGCANPNLCADPGTGPACLAATTGCTPACDANTEVCADVAGTPTCSTKFNPSNLVDVTDGVGLFSSLAFNGKDAFIAYMRRTSTVPPGGTRRVQDGDLFGVRVGAQGTVGAPVLLDGVGDTGWFPDVKIDPATKSVAVSFHDFSSKALRYYYAPTFQTGVTIEVVDPGSGAAGSGEASWVGTDSAVIFAGADVYVAYQDATKGDLKLSKRQGGWQPRSIATDGAVGFFADGVFVDGKLALSHARYKARLVTGKNEVNNTLLLESVAP